MNRVVGTLIPLRDKIFVSEMYFGEEKTESGLYLPSDDGKGSGIHPRWCRVYAVGPEQEDVQVGEWILLEHARWSRGITYVQDDGTEVELYLADNKAILLVSDEKPSNTTVRAEAAGAGSNFNFNIPGA
jgi:co-chaperonin GroES (HSP10)